MTIKLDVSTTSVVVTCTDCAFWYAFAWTPKAAEKSAVTHEENVHPESFAVRKRAKTRERVAALRERQTRRHSSM